MKRKIFYSLHREKGIKRCVEHNGFETEVDGVKFNVYVRKDGVVYIIDPKTGYSVFAYDYIDGWNGKDEIPKKHKLVKNGIVQLKGKPEILENLKKEKETETYRILQQIFKTYKKAADLEKRLEREEARRRQQDSHRE